jgi:hypothetical protein
MPVWGHLMVWAVIPPQSREPALKSESLVKCVTPSTHPGNGLESTS